jgi:hypothetical protein
MITQLAVLILTKPSLFLNKNSNTILTHRQEGLFSVQDESEMRILKL